MQMLAGIPLTEDRGELDEAVVGKQTALQWRQKSSKKIRDAVQTLASADADLDGAILLAEREGNSGLVRMYEKHRKTVQDCIGKLTKAI